MHNVDHSQNNNLIFTGTEVTIVIIHWVNEMLFAQVHRDGVGHDHIQVKVGLMMS